MTEYFPPEYKSEHFHCPHCNVYAHQDWYDCRYASRPILRGIGDTRGGPLFLRDTDMERQQVEVSFCSHCHQATLWLPEKILYPPVQTFPPANDDLSKELKKIYDEAAAIAEQSPRAACAMLRVVIEMLIKQIVEGAKGINDGIEKLVAEGSINEQITQALDILRVTGNNAVHPRGLIDFGDSTNVRELFDLVNVIAETLLSQPRRIKEMHDKLPKKSREAIKRRDGKTKK